PSSHVIQLSARSGLTSASIARSYGATAQGPETPFPPSVSPVERDFFRRLRRFDLQSESRLCRELPVRPQDAELWFSQNRMVRRGRGAPLFQSEAISRSERLDRQTSSRRHRVRCDSCWYGLRSNHTCEDCEGDKGRHR